MKHTIEYIVTSWIVNLDVPLYLIGIDDAEEYATYITPEDTDEKVTPEVILETWNRIVKEVIS